MIEAKALSEKECQDANLPPKGIFHFQVLRGVEKHSDKIGAFISLRMKLSLPNNRFRTIFDSLFFADEMMWKTRHFYASTGKLDIYESGKFMAQDCDYLEGYAEVDHRIRKDTGEIEGYIKDYLLPDAAPPKPTEEPFFDDAIPM